MNLLLPWQFAEDESNRKVLTQLKAAETLVWVLRQGEYQQHLVSFTSASRNSNLTTDEQSEDPPTHQPTPSPWGDKPVPQNPIHIPLLKAVSTAVWKLSLSPEARDRFRQLGIVRVFVRHLNQPTEEVLNNLMTIRSKLTYLRLLKNPNRFCCRSSVAFQ